MTAAPDGPHPTWSSPLATALQRFSQRQTGRGLSLPCRGPRAGRTRPFPARDPLADRPRDNQRLGYPFNRSPFRRARSRPVPAGARGLSGWVNSAVAHESGALPGPHRQPSTSASMDGSKPAICGRLKTGHFRRPETGVEIYFTASSVGNVFGRRASASRHARSLWAARQPPVPTDPDRRPARATPRSRTRQAIPATRPATPGTVPATPGASAPRRSTAVAAICGPLADGTGSGIRRPCAAPGNVPAAPRSSTPHGRIPDFPEQCSV